MKTKLFIAVSMLLILAAIVTACAPTPAPAPAPQSAPPAAAPTVAAPQPTAAPAVAQPVRGGTVTTPIGADPTFNPWHPNAFVESIFINRVMFEGLTKPGKDLAPAPNLATKWESSADGLTWTFTLRNDVKWSDGTAFSSADVAYTFNDVVLNKALGATGAGNYTATVKDVTAVDPTTVKFNLSRPFSALPSYLAYNAGILPKHALSSGDPFKNTGFNKEKPITTGAFKMETFTPGQSVTLARNDNYFGSKAYLDKLVFKIVADANTQVAQALSGEIDIMILDSKAAVDTVKARPNLQVAPRSLVQFYWFSLNQENPLFQDVKVRQAIMYAIDRKAIIQNVDKGYATIANAPISPALAAYYDSSLESKYAYDPAKAKALLAEAGWKDDGKGTLVKDGKPFAFTMDFGQRANLQPVNELVQQYLKAVGMQPTLNSMEWNAMIKKVVVDRQYEATLNWWVYPTDPDVFPYFHSSTAGKGFNIPGYKDAKLDDLLTKGQTTSDPAARKQIYKDLQTYMADTLPYIFLWYPQEIDVINTRLQGVAALNLRDGMHYVNEWWISAK